MFIHSRVRIAIRVLLGLLMLLAGAWLLGAYKARFDKPMEAAQWAIAEFRALGPWAPVAFVAAYLVGAQLFVPVTIFTLAAGPLFGLWPGFFWTLLAANLSAYAGYLLGRFLLGDWVRAKIAPRFPHIYEGVERMGWKFVVIIRTLPLFPFTPVNFALGASPIPYRACILPNLLCMIPAIFGYVWLGWSLERAALSPDGARAVPMILIAIGVLIALMIAAKFVFKRLFPSAPPAQGG